VDLGSINKMPLRTVVFIQLLTNTVWISKEETVRSLVMVHFVVQSFYIQTLQ
jgi:hypothetical protein